MNILTDEEKDNLCEYYDCSLYALNAIEKAVVEKLKAMLHEKCEKVDVGVLDHHDIERFFKKIEEGQ